MSGIVLHPAVEPSTREEFANEIRARHAESVESVVSVGKLLIAAKAALPHGEFLAMVDEDLDFGRRAAQQMMAVARNPVLLNAKHASHLPQSWYTLFQLSRLPEERLLAAIESGEVTPRTERKDVARMLDAERREDGGGFEPGPTCTAEDLEVLAARGSRFGTIYADPPWSYGNQGTRAATDNHYVTMSVADIAALPVAPLAADDAHLHLWTTNAFLFDAKGIMEAWGFTYKSCFVWVKPQMGIGNYWRVSHEFMLLGVRGDAKFRDRSKMSWLQAERTVHSRKPESVRRIVECVSPGPYLELFGRQVIDGWTVWGNEISRSMFDTDVEEIA